MFIVAVHTTRPVHSQQVHLSSGAIPLRLDAPFMLPLSQHAERLLLDTHDRFGYELQSTPIVADAELFLTRAGEDIIQSLYAFERNGKQFALRPEFTTIAMQRYIQLGLIEQVRWQFLGHTFAESTFDGYTEQVGAGFELINADGVYADLEAIVVALEGAKALGLSNLQIRLNHIGLLLALLSQFNLDSFTMKSVLQNRTLLSATESIKIVPLSNESTRQMLDTLLDSTKYGGTMGGRTRESIVYRLERQQNRQNNAQQVNQAVSFIQQWRQTIVEPTSLKQLTTFIHAENTQAISILNEWIETIQLLKDTVKIDADLVVDLNMSKSWDYYTGIVFDITANGNRIVSGGRYNDLATMMDKSRKIPAIGAAYSLYNQISTLSANLVYWIKADDLAAKINLARLLHGEKITVSLASNGTQDTCLMLNTADNSVIFRNHTYIVANLKSLIAALKEQA